MPERNSSHKRKGHPDGATAPSSKKSAPSPSQPASKRAGSSDGLDGLKDRHRKAVSALYDAFQQLTSAPTEDGGTAASAAFTALLDGAKGEIFAFLAAWLLSEMLDHLCTCERK